MKHDRLEKIYRRLSSFFGPQHWWPAESPFEVAVGAILTQNTSWTNVEKAIKNLKNHNALSPAALHAMAAPELAALIRSSGCFNIKAERLGNFIALLQNDYRGSMKRLAAEQPALARTKLLSLKGIGPETADSILLYALGHPVFVIDAYTRRVLSRHGIIVGNETYEDCQELFHANLRNDSRLFNEYHALLVRLAKDFCRTKPLCAGCPLERMQP